MEYILNLSQTPKESYKSNEENYENEYSLIDNEQISVKIHKNGKNENTRKNSSTTKGTTNDISFLTKKRKKKETFMRSVKCSLFKKIKSFVPKLRAKSNVCLKSKLYFQELKNDVYILPGAEDNLILLNKTLREVYSASCEHNKNIIDQIMSANDCSPLIDFLNRTINDLLDIYCGKKQVEEDYYRGFADDYKKVLEKKKKEKGDEYFSDLKYYSEYLFPEYKKMQENSNKKGKNNNLCLN